MIRKFCFIITSAMFAIMLLLAFTKLGDYICLNILKLSPANIEVAKLAIKFGLAYPASVVFMAYKRGKLIKIRKTTLLMFERVVGTLISLVLFIIVPLIFWQYSAGAGLLVLTAANFATGLFTHIVFKISVKKDPDLLTRSF